MFILGLERDGFDGNPRPVPKEYKQGRAKRFHIHSWTIGEAFKEMEQYEKEGSRS
ncbi:MAG: hypothetical protein WC317_07340 [Candidatus Omnitrophota bacterium]